MPPFEAANELLTPWAVLTATGALLAFLIGLYTLVGRERKSPYLINSVFLVFLVSVLSAFFSVVSVLLRDWESSLLNISVIFLLIAILLTAWRVLKIYIRFACFVDRVSLKDIPWWRWAKNNIVRQMRGQRSYEHNPKPISSQLLNKVKDICTTNAPGIGNWDDHPLSGRSLSIAFQHQGQATKILAHLAIAFLQEEGHSVQYLAASRHPIEFVSHLKSLVKSQGKLSWNEAAQRTVVVDAFTPHFGFTDSIYQVKTREFRSLEVFCVRSSVSYAGMHTATSRAFNCLKKRATSSVRGPVLVIYEDTRALVDLESHEQYHIFVRHVIPSERMWDGMFTIFTEVEPPENDWKMLSAYTSVSLDMRPCDHSVKADRENEK